MISAPALVTPEATVPIPTSDTLSDTKVREAKKCPRLEMKYYQLDGDESGGIDLLKNIIVIVNLTNREVRYFHLPEQYVTSDAYLFITIEKQTHSPDEDHE